jgi:hypothetical protein
MLFAAPMPSVAILNFLIIKLFYMKNSIRRTFLFISVFVISITILAQTNNAVETESSVVKTANDADMKWGYCRPLAVPLLCCMAIQ